MIQVTPHMRILVAVEPIDFRAGIDGLVNNCKKLLRADPFSGALFVFGNRGRTAIKVLVYDGQGFWMCHKRLSTGVSGCQEARLFAATRSRRSCAGDVAAVKA